MRKGLSKSEVEKQIENFFKNPKDKSPREIKKTKKLAMSYNLPLREKRKLFCGKCFNAYSGKEKIRIKNGKKIIWCDNCGEIGRWKINKP